MVELRYLAAPHFLKLQYRTLRPTWLASGAGGEPSQWSEWQDVSVVPEQAADSQGPPAPEPVNPGTTVKGERTR